MPKLTFRSSQSEGYKPLPDGSYNVQIDSIDTDRISSNNNAQMMIKGHVVDGPYAGKSVTLWYVFVPQSGFRTRALLEACGVDHEVIELDTLEDGKPLLDITFDPEDLIGCVFTVDAKYDDSRGKPQNRFSDERAPKGGKPASQSTRTAPASQAAAPAPAAPAAAAAAPSTVRRARTSGGVQ